LFCPYLCPYFVVFLASGSDRLYRIQFGRVEKKSGTPRTPLITFGVPRVYVANLVLVDRSQPIYILPATLPSQEIRFEWIRCCLGVLPNQRLQVRVNDD